MTDGDGGPGTEPEFRGQDSVPAAAGRSAADAPDGPYLPGPRPGLYPPPASASRDSRRPGYRRTPAPAPAQRQLMQRISAARKARLQRTLLTALIPLSALVLVVAASGWALTSYVSRNISKVDAGTSGTPAAGPINILVAGVDERSGLTPREQRELHVGHVISDNSDTLMLAHITANHSHIRVVSLPRDSWVRIPGHGMNKINAAYGLGGPRLTVRTVEQATGLTINDYLQVNFLGFVKVIDALGGVNICLPFAVNDSYTGLRLSAGRHHVDGITALKFARDRHSFALSDLARIGDQQQLLSSLFREASSTGTLANPFRLSRFLSALSAAIKVDRGFNLTELADDLRGIRPGDVTFTTVPLANINYITKTGESALLWDHAAARALFASLRGDQPPRTRPGHKRAGAAPTRRQVSIDVYNGTMIGGLSAETGARLAELGFHVHGSALTWPAQDVSQTLIEYPPGQRTAGQLVHKVMPTATLRRVTGLARIRIVLGGNGYGISATSASPGNGAGTAVPDHSRTAAQDACR
jgi:LCP family protein required for cell wall assembly